MNQYACMNIDNEIEAGRKKKGKVFTIQNLSIQSIIFINLMKKAIGNPPSNKGNKLMQISFNLTPSNLAPFKSKSSQNLPKISLQTPPHLHLPIQHSSKLSSISPLPNKEPPKTERLRSNSIISQGNFNQKLVFLQYEEDEPMDCANKQQSVGSELSDDEIVESCVRVITQETDHTSQQYSMGSPPSLTPSLTPKSVMNYFPVMDNYEEKFYAQNARNKRSITTEESKAFVIDFDKIQFDGRTTIMIKNIPNKYTQDTLLSEFSIHHESTFDFFYLPIDKDNECNVGYAFLNFVNTSHIKNFYTQFHGKRWKKYNSAKICHLCYARYQGTLQLANHFRYTKILHQKDRKLKPLIGNEALKGIEEIVKNQKKK